MIDLHCHLLPGIDDGARDLDAALKLATAAACNGISHAVLTPHVYPGRWNNSRSSLLPQFEAFRVAVEQSGIGLSLSLGGEVHLLAESIELVEKGEAPYIGTWEDHPVLLLELPDSHVPAGALHTVEFLLDRGILPMIAHPERNKGFMAHPARIEPFVRAGCLLQLTAASVEGGFGRSAYQCAWQLLETGWVTAIATDAHNLAHRPPRLAEARALLERRFGSRAGQLLTQVNPAAIIQGNEDA